MGSHLQCQKLIPELGGGRVGVHPLTLFRTVQSLNTISSGLVLYLGR